MHKSYRLVDSVDVKNCRETRYVIRLMMCTDAIRAAIRWFNRINDSPSDSCTVQVDRLMSVVVGLGWAGEAIKMMKGEAKHLAAIVEQSPTINELWKLCVDDEVLAEKAKRIRDKCAFHWDDDIVSDFLQGAFYKERDLAFIESDNGDGAFLETRYPWAQEAIARVLLDGDTSGEGLIALASFLGRTVNLTAELINELCEKYDLLKLEPCQHEQQHSTSDQSFEVAIGWRKGKPTQRWCKGSCGSHWFKKVQITAESSVWFEACREEAQTWIDDHWKIDSTSEQPPCPTWQRHGHQHSLSPADLLIFMGREPKCEDCNTQSWNGKPIPFEVDHVAGKKRADGKFDHSKYRLKILCPNCHSQTPGFRGRKLVPGEVSKAQHGFGLVIP